MFSMNRESNMGQFIVILIELLSASLTASLYSRIISMLTSELKKKGDNEVKEIDVDFRFVGNLRIYRLSGTFVYCCCW